MKYTSQKTFLAILLLVMSNLGNAESQSQFSKARLFTGEINSVYTGTYPIVVTLLENDKNDLVRILATFFVPEPISIFIPAKDITMSKDKTQFNAVTADPRGFDITWSIDVKDEKLSGVYFHQGDSGELLLEEVIDKSN